MSVKLTSGQSLPVKPGVVKLRVGLGWNPRVEPGHDFDLDASAFLLGANARVRSDDDIVYFNQRRSACGSVVHCGDNRTGVGDGDDEKLLVDLNKVPDDVKWIAFTATIYKANDRQQTFGMVDQAYIRLVDDASDDELVRYDLTEDACIDTAVVFGELARGESGWYFRALGKTYNLELPQVAQRLGVNV